MYGSNVSHILAICGSHSNLVKSAAILESVIIEQNILERWSAGGKERLCFATNCAINSSADMTFEIWDRFCYPKKDCFKLDSGLIQPLLLLEPSTCQLFNTIDTSMDTEKLLPRNS